MTEIVHVCAFFISVQSALGLVHKISLLLDFFSTVKSGNGFTNG